MLRHSLDRLERLQKRYLELHAERVEQRIVRSLLRIMNHSGKRSEDEIVIDFPISRQDLAHSTGATLYTISRTLSTSEKKGWVKSKREQTVIANPHALVLFFGEIMIIPDGLFRQGIPPHPSRSAISRP